MFSVPTDMAAIERAKWLAELSDALDTARSVLAESGLAMNDWSEAAGLYVRIEAARLEVQSLRQSRALHPRPKIAPERIDLAMWGSPTAPV